MPSEICFYHVDKTAKANCHTCLRPICEEDQQERKHLRTNAIGKVVSEPTIICTLCDLDRKIRARNAYSNLLVAILIISGFIPLSIGVGFIIVAISSGETLVHTQNYNVLVISVLVPIFILGIIAILFLPLVMSKRKQITEITGRKKLTTLKKERKEFINSVTSTKARKILQKRLVNTKRYCHNCGEKILDRETFCGHCGQQLQRILPS